MEKFLNEQISEQVRQVFDAQLKEPVEVLFFGQKSGCDTCADTLQLLQEVADISPQLTITPYDIEDHADVAAQYRVDKTPGLVLVAREGDQRVDYGVRYAGIPAGHEFSSLIHDLILISGRDSGLDAQTRSALSQLTEPVHLQVFVTPSCPYCPQAVVLAHRMAMESSLVEAEMIEATEFPDLAARYNVSGVPQTTINFGRGTAVGAVPETHLLDAIHKALAT